MIKNKKKLLIRIGSILACVLLVAGLAFPCFADVTLDQVLEQETYLNSLYGGNVLNWSGFLYQDDINYSYVTSVVKLNSTDVYKGSLGDVAFISALPSERFVALYTSQNVFQLQIFADGDVNPLVEYNFDNALAVEIVNVNIGSDGVVTYGALFLFQNNDYNIIFDFAGAPSADHSTFSYALMGVRVYNPTAEIDEHYDILPYEFQFSFLQIGDGIDSIPSVVAYQNLFGAVYYPASDLKLVIPEGGGATEEELQEAYDNGFTAGQTEGYNNGFEAAAQRDFGGDILGEAFSKPMEMLRDFTIVSLPNGVDITLGHVASALIAMLLVIAFLKIYAGG